MAESDSSAEFRRTPTTIELAEQTIQEILGDDSDLEGKFRGLGFIAAHCSQEGLTYGSGEDQHKFYELLQVAINDSKIRGSESVSSRLVGILDVYGHHYSSMPDILDEHQVKELMKIEQAESLPLSRLSDWAASRNLGKTHIDERTGATIISMPSPNRNLAVRFGQAQITPRGRAAIEAFFKRQTRYTKIPKEDQ